MSKTPKQILLEAAALIRQPGCWTQGVNARDANGIVVNSLDPSAQCWCAIGSITKAADGGLRDIDQAIALMRTVLPSVAFISSWNDRPGRTAEEVAAKLEEAAATFPESNPAAQPQQP